MILVGCSQTNQRFGLGLERDRDTHITVRPTAPVGKALRSPRAQARRRGTPCALAVRT
jgi:hypothetical protein